MIDMTALLKQTEAAMKQAFEGVNIQEGLMKQLELLQLNLRQAHTQKQKEIIENQIILVRRALSGKVVGKSAKDLSLRERSLLEEDYVKLKRDYDLLRTHLDFVNTSLSKLKGYYQFVLKDENKINPLVGFYWIRIAGSGSGEENNRDKLIDLSRITFRTKQTLEVLQLTLSKMSALEIDPSLFLSAIKTLLKLINGLIVLQQPILVVIHKVKDGKKISDDEVKLLEDSKRRETLINTTQEAFLAVQSFVEFETKYYVTGLNDALDIKKKEMEKVVVDLKDESSKSKPALLAKLQELVYGKRINVLMLGIPFELRSGVVSVTKSILQSIDRKKFNVYVITHWFNNYNYFDRFLSDSVKVSSSPYNLHDVDGKKLTVSYSFDRLLVQLKEEFHFIPDVIHLHTHTYEIDGSLTPIMNILGNPPIVYTLHQLVFFKPLTKGMQGQLLRGELALPALDKIKTDYYKDDRTGQLSCIHKVDMIITISETHRKAFQIMFPELTDKVVAIPNGTDIRKHIPHDVDAKAAAVRKVIAPSGEKIILHVGRIEAQKRPDLLFKSFNLIASRYPNVKLLMIGPKKDGFMDLAKSYGLDLLFSDKIEIIEWLSPEELTVYYKAGDILIYPLLEQELYSITVLEALMLGTPIITGESTFSFFGNTDNPENILNAFDYFINHETEVKARIHVIKDEVEERYSLKRFIKDHQEVYVSATKHRKPNIEVLTLPEHQFTTPTLREIIPSAPATAHSWNKDILFSFDGSLLDAVKIIQQMKKLGIENYRFYLMGSKFFMKKTLKKMGCTFSRSGETKDVPIKSTIVDARWMDWFEANRGKIPVSEFITSLMKKEAFSAGKWILDHYKKRYGTNYKTKLQEHFGYHAAIIHPPSQHPQHISNYYSDEAVLRELSFFEYLIRLVFKDDDYMVQYGRTTGGGGFIYGDDTFTRAKSKRLQYLAIKINPLFAWRMWRTDFSPRANAKSVASLAIQRRNRPFFDAWWDTDPCEILMHTYEFTHKFELDKLDELVQKLDEYWAIESGKS